MLTLFDKLKEIVAQRFNLEMEVFPADHWSHQTIRSEIVTLEPNEIEHSKHLSCHVYTYRDSEHQRHVITLRGLLDQQTHLKADVKNLIETLYIEPMNLLSKKNWLTQHLELIEDRVARSNKIVPLTDFEQSHIALVGSEFENLKMALEMHERSGRWAFIKIEKKEDLNFFDQNASPIDGATVYLSHDVIGDVQSSEEFLRILQSKPSSEVNWLILSTQSESDISSLNKTYLHVHRRTQANLHLVRPKSETLH